MQVKWLGKKRSLDLTHKRNFLEKFINFHSPKGRRWRSKESKKRFYCNWRKVSCFDSMLEEKWKIVKKYVGNLKIFGEPIFPVISSHCSEDILWSFAVFFFPSILINSSYDLSGCDFELWMIKMTTNIKEKLALKCIICIKWFKSLTWCLVVPASTLSNFQWLLE